MKDSVDGMKVKKVMDLACLCILIGFTFITVLFAFISKGALIYYYEPNKVICYFEIGLGSYAIIRAFQIIFDKR